VTRLAAAQCARNRRSEGSRLDDRVSLGSCT
jgi:hypothetical protein